MKTQIIDFTEEKIKRQIDAHFQRVHEIVQTSSPDVCVDVLFDALAQKLNKIKHLSYDQKREHLMTFYIMIETIRLIDTVFYAQMRLNQKMNNIRQLMFCYNYNIK